MCVWCIEPVPLSAWCMQAMYGVLSAIEGLPAFTDMTAHTGIAPWYAAVKREVEEHRGRRGEAVEPPS